MKLEVSVPELVEVFKEIQKQPEQIFEMIRMDVREIVGDYMTAMIVYLYRGHRERTKGQLAFGIFYQAL